MIDFIAPQLDQSAQQAALLVHAARVDAQSIPDPGSAPAFVDVTVQPKQWLVFFDRLAQRAAADRVNCVPGVLRAQASSSGASSNSEPNGGTWMLNMLRPGACKPAIMLAYRSCSAASLSSR
jgi:hypothetical protein